VDCFLAIKPDEDQPSASLTPDDSLPEKNRKYYSSSRENVKALPNRDFKKKKLRSVKDIIMERFCYCAEILKENPPNYIFSKSYLRYFREL
jgi:hypothetical protein